MKKLMILVFTLACSLLLATGCTHKPAAAATPQGVDKQSAKVDDRVQSAADSLNALINAPDTAIPQTILAKAKCVAVIPDMVKGGFVFGGQHGRGMATCRNAGHGWSAPAPLTLSGGTWGAQIGAESADIVLLFMNDGAVQSLLADKLKLGGEAAVTAGPVGREASAATDVKMDA